MTSANRLAILEPELRRLHALGWPSLRIAHTLDVCAATACKWHRKLGLRANGPDKTTRETWSKQLKARAALYWGQPNPGCFVAMRRRVKAMLAGWPGAVNETECRLLTRLAEGAMDTLAIAAFLDHTPHSAWKLLARMRQRGLVAAVPAHPATRNSLRMWSLAPGVVPPASGNLD